MKRPSELTIATPGLAPITLSGAAGTRGEPLRSPAAGVPCVHWRLRVFETVAPGMELVHELFSPEPFLLAVEPSGGSTPPAPRPVQVVGERTRIEAHPVLHREGSPGALAVARHFGLLGRVRVEEVVLRPGEALEVEGVLVDPAAVGAGPYRTAQGEPELHEAIVRVQVSGGLRPTLLPWALGAAAVLLGATGAATVLSKLWRLSVHGVNHGLVIHAEIGAPRIQRPRWP
jgi:hypothetical protein